MEGGAEIILWKSLCFKVIIPMLFSPFIGFFMALWLMKLLFKLPQKDRAIFRYLQIGSAGAVALAHGLNDAQKSMGIITLGLLSAGLVQNAHIPLWVIASCAVMMAIGTATGGFRIIKTMGYEITELKPIQGFAAEACSSIVILIASFLGMPLSSTHIIVGGITGVGTARGAQHVQWGTAKKLIWAWILTVPGAALASGAIFKLFINIFL
jgi:PiT family inorganic phosphate transporter